MEPGQGHRSVIGDLIRGAIDMHVHFGPDPKTERRSDAVELAERARDLGMRALVLKSHEYPTQPVAATVARLVPGVELIGSVCLDDEVGGLNPAAVEASARMGARVAWMPTFNAAAYRALQRRPGGVRVIDEGGGLTPVAREVLDVIRAHDLVLATGHVGLDEIRAVIRGAREAGIRRLVVTHVSSLGLWYGITANEMEGFARDGAMLEHCVLAMMPARRSVPPWEMASLIARLGPERCLLSTDFGQWYNPIPPEGLRMGIGMLLQAGMAERDVELLVKSNPATLLGL